MRKSLSKHERIHSREDIRALFSDARRVTGKGVKLLFLANQSDTNRVFITMTRNFGKAVIRNKAKRIIREIFRQTKASVQSGYDLGFIIYPGDSSYEEQKEQVLLLYRKAGILIEAAE